MDTKTYSKQYYEKNKEKLIKQINDAKKLRKLNPDVIDQKKQKIIKKLNEHEFIRIPYSKINKLGILFNKEKNIYY